MKNKLIVVSFLMMFNTQATSHLEELFIQAYNDVLAGKWGDVESASGPGSTLAQTEEVRRLLPLLIDRFNVTSILDAPCGDFYWMHKSDLRGCTYLGIDCVPSLIENNKKQYKSHLHEFSCKNLLADLLPYADLIISRDFLVHLSNEDIIAAIKNFKKSGARYLLTTSFPAHNNYNIHSGEWRPLNLQEAPFNFPEPIMVINEKCTEQNGKFTDKSLMLWKLDDLL